MPTVRIDHPVPDFDGWKKAFDDDPLNREQSGVRRHRIFRSVDDPNHVWIDLEFDSRDEATLMLQRLESLWQRVRAEGVIGAPEGHVVEEIDAAEYRGAG